MKYLPALCLILAALMAAGCSSDPEDKSFFGSGWVKPEAGADRRLVNPQTLAPVRNDFDPSPMKAAQ